MSEEEKIIYKIDAINKKGGMMVFSVYNKEKLIESIERMQSEEYQRFTITTIFNGRIINSVQYNKNDNYTLKEVEQKTSFDMW